MIYPQNNYSDTYQVSQSTILKISNLKIKCELLNIRMTYSDTNYVNMFNRYNKYPVDNKTEFDLIVRNNTYDVEELIYNREIYEDVIIQLPNTSYKLYGVYIEYVEFTEPNDIRLKCVCNYIKQFDNIQARRLKKLKRILK